MSAKELRDSASFPQSFDPDPLMFDVYAIGNALLDIQAHVSDSVLEELKFAKGMMTLVELETQKKVLHHILGAKISRCAGGSAANTIIGLAQFGGKGAFGGKVARDEIGQFYLKDMDAVGVATAVEPVDGQTGTSVILITEDAQRTMLTNLSVASTLTPDDVSEKQIQSSKYVYVEGYLFAGEPTRQAAYRTIELAKRHGVKVALTVSDPFLIQYHRDEFWKLIEGPVDLLFCNLEEARALTGKLDPVDCAQEIHRHAENVALTLGGDGSILMHERQVIPIEGVSCKAVDTTGAGDMYAGAILYGITNGLSWKQAGHLASRAAARVVSQLGARLAKPMTAEEIRQG
ncbi:5-dehydro-2-deoxygluconokinase [Planctomyces sp. SH-PL14]|nr:adenosine kinase [Planctomyces sp. SH-PL14]AMV18484.1 5-dehydro-2-deoxygluconokinase [Planctomyces sp. SH-PL14]